jgi:hypothetical protein
MKSDGASGLSHLLIWPIIFRDAVFDQFAVVIAHAFLDRFVLEFVRVVLAGKLSGR